ncbi:MAG: DUF6531 domain-containing protein [archaeon]
MSRKWLLCGSVLLIIFFLFSTAVLAATLPLKDITGNIVLKENATRDTRSDEYTYGVGIDALGFQADTPYFGAGTGAAVNAFSGNLVITSTDVSLPGANGIGTSFTRFYNSDVYYSMNQGSGNPGPYNMLKPGTLGHGWSHTYEERIVVPFIDNPVWPTFFNDRQFYIESGDNGRTMLLDNACNPTIATGDSDCYWPQTLFSEPAEDVKEYVFFTDNMDEVVWYHALGEADGMCLDYNRDAFKLFTKDGTEKLYSHWVSREGPYSDIDSPSCTSGTDCRQMQYPGVYLTSIRDKYNNKVLIDYYENDEGCNWGQEKSVPPEPFCEGITFTVNCGTPFVSKVRTINARGQEIARMNFYYTDITKDARLDYVISWNHNNHRIMYDYIYSGDLSVNPFEHYCLDSEMCNEDALLVEIRIYDITGDGTTEHVTVPQSGMCGEQCPGGCGLKCNEIAANNYCKALGYNGYAGGTMQCTQTNGLYTKGNWANHPTTPLTEYCGTSGTAEWVTSMDCLVTGGELFESVKYTYFRDNGDTKSFFAIEEIESSLGSTTTYTYSNEEGYPCFEGPLYQRKHVGSYTVTESVDQTYTYDYTYNWDAGSCYDSPSRTTEMTEPAQDGIYKKSQTQFYSALPTYGGYNDYVSGKKIATQTFDNAANLKAEDYQSYKKYKLGSYIPTKGTLNSWINVGYSCALCDDSDCATHGADYEAFCTDDGTYETCMCAAPAYTLQDYTTLNKVHDAGEERALASMVSSRDKYGNAKNSINFGEVSTTSSWNKDIVGDIFGQITIYNPTLPDDELENRMTYYYEQDPSFENRDKFIVTIPYLAETLKDSVVLEQTRYDSYSNFGDLLSVSAWDNSRLGTNPWLTTNLQYDTFGNMIHAIGPTGSEYFADYSDWKGVAVGKEWTYNDAGDILQKTNTYYPHTYKLNKQYDENGNTYKYEYDDLGRITKVYLPGDAEGIPSTRITYHDPPTDVYVSVESKANIGYFNPVEHHYDALGRKVKQLQEDPDEVNNIVIKTTHNDKGLVKSMSRPYHEAIAGGRSSTPLWTELSYDSMDRRNLVTPPDLNTVQTIYGPGWTKIIDEEGHQSTKFFDTYGRTIKVVDNAENDVEFEYDPLGNLILVRDELEHVSTSQYNSLGQLTASHHPDSGSTINTYDTAGMLKTSNDGLYTTEYFYDALNRIKTVEVAGVVVEEYNYDDCENGKGKLCSALKGPTSTSYKYDKIGRVIRILQTVNDKVFRTDYTYDPSGNLKQVFYPNGEYVIYGYDTISRLKTVSLDGAVVETVHYNPTGTVSQLDYGNTISTEYDYTERDWLKEVLVDSGNVFSRFYIHDNVGNIEEEFDIEAGTMLLDYGYDSVYQLKTVTDHESILGGDLLFTYDATGNRDEKTFAGNQFDYNYDPDSNKLTGSNLFTYIYSATGNVVRKVGKPNFINFNYGEIGTESYVLSGLAADVSVGDPVKVIYPLAAPIQQFVWNTIAQGTATNTYVVISNDNFDAAESSEPMPDPQWYETSVDKNLFDLQPSIVHYDYDYKNMLVKIRYPGGKCVGNVYDTGGLRVEKRSNIDELSTYYAYDLNGNVLHVETAEYAGTGCEPETTSPVCGNGILEFGEVCDGEYDDYIADCADYGQENPECGHMWGGQMVRCVSCNAVDTSECSSNSDGVISDGETCDMALPDITCADAGCNCNRDEYPGCYPSQPDMTRAVCACGDWDYPLGVCDCDQTLDCTDKKGFCRHRVYSDDSEGLTNCECVKGTCRHDCSQYGYTQQTECEANGCDYYLGACRYKCTEGDVFECEYGDQYSYPSGYNFAEFVVNKDKDGDCACEYDIHEDYPTVVGCCLAKVKPIKPTLLTAIPYPGDPGVY